jgi:dinuclear metal center YbgI/SA1388 family protein
MERKYKSFTFEGMETTVSDLLETLHVWAPPSLQESYDNSGLLVGEPNTAIQGVLVALDMTEEVVAEAASRGCNVIVAHHPIIFSGLKRLTGANYVERTVMAALRAGIALIAVHTNLDAVQTGVNAEIGKRLGLKNLQILRPVKGRLKKLVIFTPESALEAVREAVFAAGAGQIGNYDACSFQTSGMGTFRAGVGAEPYVGEMGALHRESEVRLEVVVPDYDLARVTRAMRAAHPYEEVAYDVLALENSWSEVGSGMMGELPEAMPLLQFLEHVKVQLHVPSLKYTQPVNKTVQKIAFCGGSGSFLLPDAKASGADLFLTSDLKYHQFFDADGQIVLVDIGHYENEQFTNVLIVEKIKQKFTNFAIRLAETNTNPINYL